MANIIQPTDFEAELFIANAAQPGVSGELNSFITKYERLFLRQLFGDTFYAVFIADITEQRFIDLIAIPEFKTGIASYIYYYYIRNQVTQTVGMGNVEPKSGNATVTNHGRKQTRAFNEMVKCVYEVIRYITTSGLFPEYVEPQWLRWRMQRDMLNWWIQDYYLYPIGFRNIPEIFNSITENNI